MSSALALAATMYHDHGVHADSLEDAIEYMDIVYSYMPACWRATSASCLYAYSLDMGVIP